MGSYTFKWEHPADEVYVTGTFDDWGKTVKLEKGADGVFTKTVQLPHSQDNVYYKFVKDGEWVTSHTAPTETDSSGNTNNVLKPHDFISSAAAGSTTAALAGAVPKTGTVPESTPGAFPETPAAAGSGEPKDFSVNPIPASAGAGNPIDLKPGEKVPEPSTINSNTIQSGVHNDPELKAQDEAKQTVGVAPIPASSGLGNPIDLKPGEKVPEPSTINSNTVNSTVKTDKASYEKSDAYPTDGTGDQSKKLDTAGGMFGVAPVAGTMIPESSLPMGQGSSAKDADPGVTTQSAAPESTTAALAGQVPREPRNNAAINSAAPGATTAALAGQVPKESAAGVPEEVKESQQEAGVGPEASANPEAVKEKAAVEKELLKEVKPDNSAGEPAPTESAATATTAPAATTGTPTGGSSTLQPPAAAAESEQARSRDVSPMTKSPTTASTAGPSATTGVAAASVPEKSLPETPKKDTTPGGVGRRMSGAFKKVMGESSSPASGSGAAATTPASAKTEGTATDSTPGSGSAKGHKKKQSIFKKLKEAFHK